MLQTFLQDLKHATRMFGKNRGFVFAAVAALGLGIGANTAIFSVVNAVLIKPLPFPNPDRLVVLGVKGQQGRNLSGSPAKFMHWREQSSVLSDVAAFNTGFLNYTGGATPVQFRSAQVSANFFALFGAHMIKGQPFTADQDLPNAGRFVVITKALWNQQFHSDPEIVGSAIRLGGDPYTVTGVMDNLDLSDLGDDPQVVVPFQFSPSTTDQGHYFSVGARLKPGVTLDQANAELEHSTAAFNARFPGALGKNTQFFAVGMGDAVVANARSSLYVLLGAVGLVLLIACANVANLLLAQATGRRREIAIRAALGGSRGRIVRQLLTESIMLSMAGGVLGLVLGAVGIRALLSVNTAGLPRVGPDGAGVHMDWRVLLFTLAVALGTGIVFGLIPALNSSRTDLAGTFKEGGSRNGSGFRHNKARSIFIVTEIGLALVLLIGSALLIRTDLALSRVDPGFDASNVLTMRMSLTGQRWATSASVASAIRDGVTRVRAIPGVETASATCCVPLQGGYGLPFDIVGQPPQNGAAHTGGASWQTISPGYFAVFRIPVKRGRDFTDQDDGQATPVVIINEAMAKQFWPKGDALGSHIVIGRHVMKEFDSEPERLVVGIVGDTRDNGLESNPSPRMFEPQAQSADAVNQLNSSLSPLAWVVRTRTPPQPLASKIEAALRAATGLPVSRVESMNSIVATSISRQRFNMWLMSVFGLSALVLAAIGIYGLMAYTVEQRTQEIGIRLALGADGARVKGMVVAQGMTLAIVGIVIGLAAAFGLTRLLASFLYGVQPYDPVVFVAVPLVLTLISLAAVWWPARRASGVDPLVALRYE